MSRSLSHKPGINAGAYRHRITIFREVTGKDVDGFPVKTRQAVLTCHAQVKTTSGYTMVKSGTDFEKAYTSFTIRWPQTAIDRDMLVQFRGRTYTIEYLNNVDEKCVQLEIQTKEVTH